MLEQFMSGSYSLPNYVDFNDILLYTDYINRKYTYQQVTVEPIEAYRFQGNLYGLFRMIGIKSSLFPYALYLNGYNNPCSYEGKKIEFKIPIPLNIPEY